jgi:hypothetical protein
LAPDAIKKTGIGWLVGQVVHHLIKSNMLSGLDTFRDGIIVENIFHGLGETEEDANTGVRFNLGGAAGTGGKSIDAATEDTE